MSTPLEASCHCGAVRVTIPTAPAYINECNCSFCVKRGATWGYFTRAEVIPSGDTSGYVHARMANPFVRVYFCPNCGCTTHGVACDDTIDWTIVNMRLFDPDIIAGVEIRYPDGRNWTR